MPENPLLTVVPKILENALSDPAKEVGRFVSNIFYVVFSPINFPTEKYRLRQEKNLEAYSKSLDTEISKIPESNLIDPPLNIVGPALEASKYYIEDEPIRNMFAKLIASSMNSETTSNAHPSFIEMIKQMTPLDAQNLSLIGVNDTGLPIANCLVLADINSGELPILRDLFLNNDNCKDHYLNAASLKNLERLGLIELDYLFHFKNDDLYEPFQKTEEYLKIVELSNKKGYEVSLQKGRAQVTTFGNQFYNVCIE
ncbi:DUF4393 domain-containing protein [Exiguobacterium sp. s63]|uniref:DUF4393 domain-containing protein n=1 Tax=Exiguobacterium sp. s63 TaxID=2751274 RepID=UPI001BEC1D78|nr:DUF4393 domain-containing protein [Exiguobacterium sp. s63]